MNGEQTVERVRILRILLGVFAGLLTMLIVNVVLSALILNETMSQDKVSVYAFVATALGAAVSGIVSSHKNKVLLYSLVSAALYFAVRWLLGAILFSESMQWGLIVSLVVSIIFSVLGAMLGTVLRHK